MNSSFKENTLTFLLYALAFYLYYVVLLVVFKVGLAGMSQLITIPYRACVLALGGGLFLYGIRNRKLIIPRWYVLCFSTFWALWLFQLLYDSFVRNELLPMTWLEYLQRAFGMAALPSLGFSWILLNRERWAFTGFLGGCWLFNLVSFLAYRGLSSIGAYRMLAYYGVDRMELISPLALSYGGAALCSMSLWCLTRPRLFKGSLILWIVGVGFGGINCMIGGSRGAIIVVATTFIVLLITGWRSRLIIRRFFVIAAGVGVLFIAFIITPAGNAAFHRMMNLYDEISYFDERAGSGRLGIYKNTVSQFMENPVIGNGIVERNSLNYPHNRILEAYMATGVFGGTAFLVIFVMGWYYSWRLLSCAAPCSWLSIMYVCFCVDGMFSGSVIAPNFWYAATAVIANGIAYFSMRPQVGQFGQSMEHLENAHYLPPHASTGRRF